MPQHKCPICGGDATINTEATRVQCDHIRCRAVTAYPYTPPKPGESFRPIRTAGPYRSDEPYGDR